MHTSLAKKLVLWTALAVAPLAHAADYLEFKEWNLDWSNNGTAEMPARLYVPTNYNPAQKYPLVIFMHGGGETGTNNQAQLNVVQSSLIPKVKARGWFMYAAQVPNGSSWYDQNVVDSIRQAVFALANYNIDPERIYVTGLSMGGGGTKTFLRLFPNAFAAGLPLCATADANHNYVSTIVGKPIWAFHGEKDESFTKPPVSHNYVSAIINAAQNQGHTPPAFPPTITYPNNSYYLYDWNGVLRYTEYKDGPHNIWTRTYNDNDGLNIYDWIAAQSADLDVISLQPGETALLDVGSQTLSTTTDSQGRKWNAFKAWNGLWSKTGIFPFIVTTAGRPTSVNISQMEPFTGMSEPQNGYSRTGFDDNMAKDGWSISTGSTPANAAIWKIHGLVPGASYAVEAFASQVPLQWENGRWTRYQLESVTSGTTTTEYSDLNAAGNTSGTAATMNINAGDDGSILLKVFPAPGKGSTVAQLNMLSITRTGSSAPQNQAPVVSAGADQTTTLYDGVVLSGTASDDGLPTGSSLSTTWSKESGPGMVTFTSTTSLSTNAAFSDPGTYVLKLTASDSELEGSDTVTITVNEWKNMDIGTVPVPGTGVITSGTLVLTGSGDNIWKDNDDFHFMFRPVTGDCSITVRQLSHPYQHWSSKAGIMLRGTLGRDATHCFMGMLPGGGNSIAMRHHQGYNWSESVEAPGAVPFWLKIQRSGNTISCHISQDGTVWLERVSYSFTSLPATMYIGFATASAAPYTLTSVFDNITVSP